MALALRPNWTTVFFSFLLNSRFWLRFLSRQSRSRWRRRTSPPPGNYAGNSLRLAVVSIVAPRPAPAPASNLLVYGGARVPFEGGLRFSVGFSSTGLFFFKKFCVWNFMVRCFRLLKEIMQISACALGLGVAVQGNGKTMNYRWGGGTPTSAAARAEGIRG